MPSPSIVLSPRDIARIAKRRQGLGVIVAQAQRAKGASDTAEAVGELHEAAVLAAVKASYPGRQTTKNITEAFKLGLKGYRAELRYRAKHPHR